MRSLVLLVLPFAIFSCAAEETAVERRARAYREALDLATITMGESIGMAQLETMDGIGFRAELLTEGATPIFAIGARDGVVAAQLKEVHIDAVSGDVVSQAQFAGTAPACPDTQPLAAAIDSAQGELGGEVVTIAPDDDGGCNRQLHVLRGYTLWSVKLAPDGLVLAEEEDDDAD